MDSHFNWKAVESHWDDYKDRIRSKWDKLTEEDMRDIHGDRYRLMQALQDRYHIGRDKVEQQVEDFIESAGSWIEGVQQRVMDAAKQGKQYLQENSIDDMTADIRRMIRNRPIRTVLVGMGIGYLFGRLFSGNSHS